MNQIGTFTKDGEDFRGEIVTLSLHAKSVAIARDEDASGNAPTHRVTIGNVAEIGVAWAKTSKDGRDYLSVKLDDPSFTAPIFAQLFEDHAGGWDLVWSRQRRGES
ncbi:DUF736 domain-containing protein [Sphingopyxis sp. JAI108]|uniref:DUF736 domain-containing protein n=1 Tax=Sphingopyxis sp. JAI108 TaxID=2723060 RepID=UPI0015CDF735|nr:DUF736 domain-containing protein [Sphingopyxis sp. JAI108]NYF32544.1 uncharacterized protein (DUF736 family) [Sphingopyxis sp. JAI108]